MLTLSKTRIDQIHFYPASPPKRPFLEWIDSFSESGKLGVLQTFFGTFCCFWVDLFDLAQAILIRSGLGIEGVSFSYVEKEEAPEMKEAQVFMCDLWNVISIKTEDFESLMLRYFQAAVKRAETYQDPILQDENWPNFLNNIRKLERIVKKQMEEHL